jgi:hypothetical protein
MIRLPLTVQTIEKTRKVRSAILHHLGDSIYGRYPEKYEDVDVPEPIASCRALGTPSKARGSKFGSVLTFRNERAFAMLFFHHDPEDGISYSLGSHAGWQNGGTESHLRQHHEALDAVLEELGVLHDSYQFTCPCGHEGVINGAYTDVADHINKHGEEDHTERRTPTMTLVNREVTANPPAQSESEQRQQANS